MKCEICNYQTNLHYRYMRHMTSHYDNIKLSEPFISTDCWINICDIKIINKDDIININHLNDNKINKIFLKTELIIDLIDYFINIKVPFLIVLSCNDDICFPHINYPNNNIYMNKINKLLKNEYLLKILVKNVSLIHNKIIPIPIGPKWQWQSTNFFGENKGFVKSLYDKYFINVKNNFIENKQKLLYVNLSENTSKNPCYTLHTDCRKKIIDILNNNIYNQCENLPFDKYLLSLKNYKFCISPPGRGIDCHRTWEALHLGVIPILLSSPIDNLFIDLPVIILNNIEDFNKINNDFLITKHINMINNIKNNKYNLDKLFLSFWKNKINSV